MLPSCSTFINIIDNGYKIDTLLDITYIKLFILSSTFAGNANGLLTGERLSQLSSNYDDSGVKYLCHHTNSQVWKHTIMFTWGCLKAKLWIFNLTCEMHY